MKKLSPRHRQVSEVLRGKNSTDEENVAERYDGVSLRDEISKRQYYREEPRK